MRDVPFQAGGPLLADSLSYIVREADEKVVAHLRRMEYITLVEPRELGKTSMINRLIGQLSPQGYTFAVRDLMAAKSSATSPADWYASLGKWLSRQLSFVPPDRRPRPPTDAGSWEDFLAEVAERAEAAGQNVVIVLDEIGALPSDWATDFFSVIRSIYTSRQNLPFWQRLTFIIAGAFNPKELIQDRTVSNFNVDQRIPLNDFNEAQVKQLVAHLGLPDDLAEATAKRIFYWSDGQPYLSQWLCLYLAERKDTLSAFAIIAVVDDAVEHFFHDDTHHLSRIKDLVDEPELLAYARTITSQPKRFSAGLNDNHFRLAHIVGVVKAGPDGLCRVRNRIYERALADMKTSSDTNRPVEAPPTSRPAEAPLKQDEFRYDAFISYSHKDSAWVRDRLLPRLEREGLSVCIDHRDFEIGVPSLDNMEHAVERSRKTLLVLTPHWVASEWTAFESLLLQTQDPAGRGRRILPLLAQPCELPRRLEIFTYLDLTDPADFDFQIERLVKAIRPSPSQLTPAKPALAQEAAPPVHPATSGFSYGRGLVALKQRLEQADAEARLAFAVLESRLRDNLQDDRLYGSTEVIRSERARIVYELNRLALNLVGPSFNELCGG